ncbi:MAG: hypothetical protein IGR92_16380 [Leptolyngbyaceae cyanobacterium T60_A2020_046]|nr:hypothetical protein [Leptolyngbyaceae cyanobacterium T60_A2020_046]
MEISFYQKRQVSLSEEAESILDQDLLFRADRTGTVTQRNVARLSMPRHRPLGCVIN